MESFNRPHEEKQLGQGHTDDVKPNDHVPSPGCWSRLKTDKEYRIRLLHTWAVMWMFVSLGWLISVNGATFPDIRLIVHKDLETASWLNTAGVIGYMLGALVFGLLFDKMNRFLLLIAILVLAAVINGIYPWCEDFPLMIAVQVCSGIMSGGIDVGGNSHIASIWGRHAAPFMQWIHLGFSFGGFPSPLTADPFLAEKQCVPSDNAIMSTIPSQLSTESIATNNSNCVEEYGETHVHYAFLICGVVILSAALPFLIMYIIAGKKKSNNIYITTPYELHADVHHNISAEDHLPNLPLPLKLLIVTCLMCLIALYAASEGRFSGLLSTFVTDELDWSTTSGNHVTSLFWGTFAAGRFTGIFVTRFLPPSKMIAVYLMALNFSFVGFFLGAQYRINEMIWMFSGFVGFSMSVIFPAIFAWTAESVVMVTGKISAFYIVGVSIWSSVLALLYGHLMDRFTSMYFIYLLMAQSVLCLGIYLIIHVLATIYIKPKMVKPEGDKQEPHGL